MVVKPDSKGSRSFSIDIKTVPEKGKTNKQNKGLISASSDLLLEDSHNTPVVQFELSDSAMQTKLFWQEDKSLFNLQLSKQIILSN